jgi:hypothetical protein
MRSLRYLAAAASRMRAICAPDINLAIGMIRRSDEVKKRSLARPGATRENHEFAVLHFQ